MFLHLDQQLVQALIPIAILLSPLVGAYWGFVIGRSFDHSLSHGVSIVNCLSGATFVGGISIISGFCLRPHCVSMGIHP